MKKKFTIFTLLLSAIGLVSCNGKTNPTASLSSPSSSAPIFTEHKINLQNTEVAKLTVDKTSAKAGDKVTITISEFDETKEPVLSSNPDVEFVFDSNSTVSTRIYTFVMIEEDVSIAVTLEEKSYSITEAKFISFLSTPEIQYLVNGVAKTGKNDIKAGSNVTINLSGLKDAEDEKTAYLYLNDENPIAAVIQSNKASFEFVMPFSDASLVFYEVSKEIDNLNGFRVTIDGNLPVGVKVYGISSENRYKKGYGFSFVIISNDDYLVSVTYKIGNGQFKEISSENIIDDVYTVGENINYDLILKINSTKSVFQDVSYVGFDKVKSIGTSSDFNDKLPNRYLAGKKFSISSIFPNDGMFFSKVDVVDSNGEKVAVNYINGSDGSISFDFIMPNDDVTITLTSVSKSKVVVNTNANIEYIHISDDSENPGTNLEFASPRSLVYVFVVAKDGYVPSSVIYTPSDEASVTLDLKKYDNNGIYYTQFTMPYSDVVIDVNVSKLHSLRATYADVEGNSIAFSKDSYIAGEEVTFQVTAISGYVLNQLEVTVNGETSIWEKGKDFNLDKNSGSFKMPEGDTTVKPLFVVDQSEKYTLSIIKPDGISFGFNIIGDSTFYNANSTYPISVELNDNIVFRFASGASSITVDNGGEKITYNSATDIDFFVNGNVVITFIK